MDVRARLATVVVGTPDPRVLAAFYERLLGWTRVADEPPRSGAPPEDGWVMLRPPSGGTGLSFQYERGFVAPTWPPTSDQQQMTMHLDLAVNDLEQGVAWARDAGAVLADDQPQERVRVMLDPHGHPFCLFVEP